MINMKILATREDWLKHRMKGIGGSEIASVVGKHPYMTNVELQKIKTGKLVKEDISDNPYVKYGTEAETHLRELFKLDFPQFKVDYVENNSFHNDRFPWANASLDGWITDQDGRKGILEIKTTNILQSQQKEKWNHRIPDNYYCQVLFYMAVMEADFCVLKAQLKTEFDGIPYLQTKHYFIEASDVVSDMNYIMTAGEHFWNEYVLKDQEPPMILPEI